MKSKYVLLLEPSPDYLLLQETALTCLYQGKVHSFTNFSKAKETLKLNGAPELIIGDSEILLNEESQLLSELTQQGNIPIILTSMSPIPLNALEGSPFINSFLEKNLASDAFKNLLASIISSSENEAYFPVSINFLLKTEIKEFDFFIKLSRTNFVKVLNKNEEDFQNEIMRLSQKGIEELYLKASSSQEFLTLLERKFQVSPPLNSDDSTDFVLDHLEALESLAKVMKWSPAVVISAQESVTEAIKLVSSNKKFLKILKRRLNTSVSSYSRHIGLLTYLSAGLGAALEVGEQGQVKLAMASLIHDLAVPEEYYGDIKDWDRRAADRNDKSPEVIKYRMHPFDASQLLQSLDTPLADVEQIILQHHEIKDGSGFPRGIGSDRINLLSTIFIMVEDLLDFIEKDKNMETSVIDFITWGRFFYDTGHFMKTFSQMEEMLRD